MPQRQNYPTYNKKYQILLPITANCNSVLHIGQNNLSAPFNSNTPNNLTNKNASHELGVTYESALHQPYQSNPFYHDYQRNNEKGIYQVNNEESDPYPKGFYTTLE